MENITIFVIYALFLLIPFLFACLLGLVFERYPKFYQAVRKFLGLDD